MQRAISARTSVLSAASKRAPFYRSGLNLQQQRFAHKVCDTIFIYLNCLRIEHPKFPVHPS